MAELARMAYCPYCLNEIWGASALGRDDPGRDLYPLANRFDSERVDRINDSAKREG
jgi:hypothetical protein